METIAHTPADAATDAAERAAILTALDAFIRQRPGLDYRNYDRASYAAEVRSIGRDLRHARALLRAVELRPSITAAMLKEELSGRLSWDGKRLEYTTGQYWPTEYRAAACRALSVALWSYWGDCVPATPAGYAVIGWGNRRDWYAGPGYATRAEAEAALAEAGGHAYGHIVELYGMGNRYYSAGDHIRQTARRELGAPIARRWFT